jgi:predicted metal-binding membrane protein
MLMIDKQQQAPNGNGSAEEIRERDVARWLAKQTTERDSYAAEVAQLKSEATGMHFKIEVLQEQLAGAESKIAAALALRDQAIAERAAYETMFIGMYASMRAFKVPAAPLIKENPPSDEERIGGA